MEKKKANSKIKWMGIVLILALGLRGIAYFQAFSVRLRPDDFGPLVYPASLAGYDFRSFFSTLNLYYGFGYYWIFAPLFKLIDSPTLLLAAIAAVNSVMIALTACLVYHLLTKYFALPGRWESVIIALLAVMFQGDVTQRDSFWMRTDNEVPFFLVAWLTVFILLAANHERAKKRWMYLSGLAALVLSWGLMVHERAMALLIAVCVGMLFVRIMKKQWVLHPLVYFPALAAGFVLQRLIRNQVIRYIWKGGWPAKNTSALKNGGIGFLKTAAGIRSFLLVLFGNLHSFLIRGFGLPVFAVVIVLCWLFGGFFKRQQVSGQKHAAACVKTDRTDSAMLILMIFGMSVLITIMGLAVKWGAMLTPGLAAGKVVYQYKAICYSRYYYLFIGPVVVMTILSLYRKKQGEKRTVIFSWVILLALELIFVFFVFPYCVKGGNVYVRRTLGTYFVLRSSAGLKERMLSSFAVMGISVLLYTCAYLKVGAGDQKRVFSSAALCGLFMLLIFGTDRAAQANRAGFSLRITQGTDEAMVLSRLQEEEALPECVYVPANKTSCGIQYLKKELPLIGGIPAPEDMEKDNLVIAGAQVEVLSENGYSAFWNEDFWIYTNNAAAAGMLSDVFGMPEAQEAAA